MSVIIKEGVPHHPHSLQDPKPIADWIEENVRPEPGKAPDFPGMAFEKSYFYSFDSSYRWFPSEGTYMTCRGPAFTDCYDRYDAIGKMVEPDRHGDRDAQDRGSGQAMGL